MCVLRKCRGQKTIRRALRVPVPESWPWLNPKTFKPISMPLVTLFMLFRIAPSALLGPLYSTFADLATRPSHSRLTTCQNSCSEAGGTKQCRLASTMITTSHFQVWQYRVVCGEHVTERSNTRSENCAIDSWTYNYSPPLQNFFFFIVCDLAFSRHSMFA